MLKVFFASRAIAPFSALIGRLSSEYRLRSSRRHVAVDEVCLVLLNLMRDLQLHRGLSGAVLDGQARFGNELEATEHKLERSLYALADQYGDRHPVFRRAQWRLVLGRWESLRNYWRGLDFYTNLFVHSETIVGLIGILRTLSSDYGDRLDGERANMVSHWPALIEQLGILRALGLHILSHREQTTDALLEAKVGSALDDYLQDARRSLTGLSKSIPDPALVFASELALHRVAGLLDGQVEPVPVQIFYREMTVLIDQWYQLITVRMLAIKEKESVARRLASYARFQPKTG